MNAGVTVKGSGLICAIGFNKQDCLQSLKEGRSGISKCELLQTAHKEVFPVGEIKLSNAQLLEKLQIPIQDSKRYTRTTLLAIVAAKEAIADAGIQLNDGKTTGLVLGTSVGGMTETELKFNRTEEEDYLLTHPCGDVPEKLARFLGINDYFTAINTACSSAANAIMHGIRLLNMGMLDRVIVGGADALSVYTVNGFNSLMILSQEPTQPFDAERKGLNLGEGAAFLVLEKAEADNPHNSKPTNLKVLACANSNDAYHQTASSPEGNGAFSAMSKALEKSGVAPEKLDYINAHGTGTSNNDLTEGIAFKRVFGDNIPLFSSTKAYTGHTLGAAAAVEAVISLLSLEHNLIFPNLNFNEPIEELGIRPVTELTEKDVNIVLSNSFGFGGNDSSVVFAKN